MVEKPLPGYRRRTYDVPIAGDHGRPEGGTPGESKQIPPAAGGPGSPPD